MLSMLRRSLVGDLSRGVRPHPSLFAIALTQVTLANRSNPAAPRWPKRPTGRRLDRRGRLVWGGVPINPDLTIGGDGESVRMAVGWLRAVKKLFRFALAIAAVTLNRLAWGKPGPW